MAVLRVTHTKYWSQEESRKEKLRSLCGAGGRGGARGAFPNRPKKLLPLFSICYMCIYVSR